MFSLAAPLRCVWRLQGGLSDFARGLEYNVEHDVFKTTTSRQLVPLFEAIFESAPTGYDPA